MRARLKSQWLVMAALLIAVSSGSDAYGWPAASLESRHKNCMGCHTSAGSWTDTSMIVIDIVDPVSKESFRKADGSFEIPVKRGAERRVKSIFGMKPGVRFPPDMVGWLYVFTPALESAHESALKFAPGWEVNRPFCGKRLVEQVDGCPGDKLAAITMTIRPLENAQDTTVDLQVLFKSLARGLAADYYERSVRLVVTP